MSARRSNPTTSDLFDQITWRGEVRGSIKRLAGYASHHRLPRAHDSASTEFVRRIGASLVAEQCVELFGELRNAFGYKRREVVVSEEAGLADLVTPDFTVHLRLEQDDEDPRRYRMMTEVSDITRPEALHSSAFANVFEGRFQTVVFTTPRSISIDAVIDRVEDREEPGHISVDYPPDASHCAVTLRATRTTLHFTPTAVTLRLDPGASLADLLEGAARLPELLGREPGAAPKKPIDV